jgi:coenzyme F420-reducing hydrogenase beta subunit
MVKLATHDACTGCGACAFKCPKQCISMKEDAIGQIYPLIDSTNCIECYSCEKVCPILNEPTFCQSKKAYAAWSNDKEERRTSASGGIAIEMYKYAISNGWLVVGAVQNKDFSVSHKMVSTYEELAAFKNSKYVFSDAYAVFSEIKSALNFKDNKKVLFIGLPCQVAALRKLFRDNENLLLVEVVCHGTTPFSYLKQHIDILSSRYGKTATRMSFRDPILNTYTFTLTLYNKKGELFYAKRTKDGDTYQFGYHRAVSYRENCYQCRFAKPERNADITIADYHGLGLSAPCSFSARKVSLILENTSNGSAFVDSLIHNRCIHAEQRPLEEPFKGEAQLRHPSQKNKYRLMFEKEITASLGDFETAITKPFKRYNRDLRIKNLIYYPYRMARKIVKKITR